MPSGVPTPTLLTYSDIVDVNMADDNDVNFADIEDYGHRVIIQVEKIKLNEIFRWTRSVGDAQPSAQIGTTTGFRSALIDALGTTHTDIDGVTGGLHFGSANLSLNSDTRLRKDGAISANDIPMAFVLYKLYENSTVSTLGNIFNLQDAHDMLTNTAVADAIIASLEANEAGAVNTMFKDLLAADPRRFFSTSGVPVTGIFETNIDISGNGSWNITDNDIIEIKTKLIFNSKVTRRGTGGGETNITGTDGSSTQNNQQTVISPGDYFYIRLQLKAADVGIASSIEAVKTVTSPSSFTSALSTLSSNLTSTNKAAAKAELKASMTEIKANLGVDYLSVTGSAIQGLVTDTVAGYDITAKEKVFLLFNSGDTVTIDPTIEDQVLSGNKEMYFFGLPGETVTLSLGGSLFTIGIVTNGVTYNGTTYALGSTVPLGNFSFALNFLGSAGGTIKGFKPTFVGEVVTWLDASDESTIVTNGSGIMTQWRDKSTYANNYNVRDGTPTRILDGARYAVNYPYSVTNLVSSRSDIVYKDTGAGGYYTSIFLVVKKTGGFWHTCLGQVDAWPLTWLQYYQQIPIGSPNMGGNEICLVGGGIAVNGNSTNTVHSTSTFLGNYHILQITFTGAGWLHNRGTRSFSQPLVLGCDGNTWGAFEGTVCEYIVMNKTLVAGDGDKIVGYLAHKWNLTNLLPTSHPYKSTPPS
jgi:hypothetical protein